MTEGVMCTSVDKEMRDVGQKFDQLYYVITLARDDGNIKNEQAQELLKFLDQLKEIYEARFLTDEIVE